MTRWFGRYRLDGLIGRGSVGEVWRACDDTGRVVALKILSVTADEPDYRRRFEREARIGADLADPHIVPIFDFGERDGRLFLAMAYIPGVDLAARLRSGPMDVDAAVDVIAQVASALDAAHAAGLVHRDVKPANVIVHASGFAYLIDFGIARAAHHTTITATGFTVGTLAYMAPERFSGHGDARSDIYSLACVLYECLTAERPFGDTDPVRQLHAHLHEAPPSARALNPAVPQALDAVIARGMAKSADERYRSAGELAAAARAAIGAGAVTSRVPPVLDADASAPTSVLGARAQGYPPAAVRPGRPGPGLAAEPGGRFDAARDAGPAAADAPGTRLLTTWDGTGRRASTGTAVKVAALAFGALVVFAAIALGTALLTRDGNARSTTPPATPPASVAPAPAPTSPIEQTTTDAPPPPTMTIPVPPGFGTPPFQIPGISQNQPKDDKPGNPAGHGNPPGHDKKEKKDK
ncbi:serine/threonine-protein kinase [Nocardia sp. NPDC004068]|uniref:serine/threonine-protein kinase n=1 Tax=Nocardia sp. NPDC004068 TaxID=3364303 RepID=UPI003696B3B3